MVCRKKVAVAATQKKWRLMLKRLITTNAKNLTTLAATLAVYAINQYILKRVAAGILADFCNGYLNDCLAPLVLLPFSAILLSFENIKLHKVQHIALIIIPGVIVWELIAPIYNRSSVSDVFDVVCYAVGSSIYWLIINNTEGRRK
jgi:hypothetical protein